MALHGESLSYASIDEPPPEFVEIEDSTNSDNVPLTERFSRGHNVKMPIADPISDEDKVEEIGFDDAFFEELDDVEVLEPFSATSLRAVQMDDSAGSAFSGRAVDSDESACSNVQPVPGPSTLGRDVQNATFEEQANRDRPHYFDYEGYTGQHQYS